MRVYVIDAGKNVPEQRRGIIGVDGSARPSAAEKIECIEVVTRLADQGWAIAAQPGTPIGALAVSAARAMGVPVVVLDGRGRIRASHTAAISRDRISDAAPAR